MMYACFWLLPSLTKTMMNPMRAKSHSAELIDKRLEDQHPFQKTVATSRWSSNPSVQIAGNLQTTIGVAVAKLLADERSKRNGVVQLLIGDVDKRAGAHALLEAAILVEQYLTKSGGLLENYVAQ